MLQENEISLGVTYGTMTALKWVNQSINQRIAVLALHGWLDNANSFAPLAPFIIQSSREMIALDLAGHGHSDHRAPGVQYHLVDYVFDVIDVVDRLGWDHFVLLGHSMGAGIACLVAAVAPERVSRLVLIDGIGPMSTQEDKVARQLMKSIHLYKRFAANENRMIYPDWQTLIELRVAAAGTIDMRAAELLVRRNAKQIDGEIVWLADRRLNLVSPVYLYERQVLSFLSSIQAPTLLIRA